MPTWLKSEIRKPKSELVLVVYFLKRLSKALRASDGVELIFVPEPESLVSLSIEARGVKNSQILRTSFRTTLSGIG
jgi:hypothetical protein